MPRLGQAFRRAGGECGIPGRWAVRCFQGVDHRATVEEMGFDMLYILEGSYSNEILLNLKFKQSSSQINFYMVGNKSEQIVPLENGLIFF